MSATLTVYVYTSDLERMRRFYEEALGAKADTQHGNWVPLELKGATFALHQSHPDGGEDLVRPNISFGVDDVEAAVERFTANGAKVLRGVADETFGRMATLEDPDGRVFEVVQYG
ncbi:MAG: VOC family protein [Dehalococcoidia bacterium]